MESSGEIITSDPTDSRLPGASSGTDERSRLLTLVFTDLVDSTGLKTRLGDTEAGRRIGAHHEGMRELTERTGGREIMSAGDGSFITFETPSQAVEFALLLQEFHRNSPSLPSVRIGIHMGEVTERHSDAQRSIEIEGLAVDIASRIQNLARPRQILMSYPVFDNARQRMNTQHISEPVEWRAHGRYIFQGTDMALEIFEAGFKGQSPFSPPPGSTKAHRDVRGEEEATLGWRPAQGLEIPGRANWVLLEKLGEGGFGDVWLAEHCKTRERHVIKFCYSTDRLRALKREVTLFRLLKETLGDRQDIARVMDYQFDAPPYYLEMEFAGQHNLTSWLEHQGGVNAIPLEQRIELVAQVADAVAAAHSVGVLHKDIKPSNIMVTDGGGTTPPHIRMIDFGIGTVSDRQLLDMKGITATGLTEVESSSEPGSSLTGTRLYMAPELIEGQAATTKSDIYSLGVVLYQLVSGKLGQSLAFGWERDIPDELLREDIQACVDGRPDNRIGSAELLADRLRSLPARRAEARKRERDLARLEEARRRRKFYWIMAALATILLIFFAQFAFLQKEKAETAQFLQKRAEQARADAVTQANKTKAALAEAEKAHYFGAIALAEASLRESRFDKMQEVLLNDAPVEFRQREWGWLLAQSAPEDIALRKYDIYDVAFLPDGNRLVAGSRDGVGKGLINVYDLNTGHRTFQTQTNNRLVWNLALSPDGKTVATASSDNIIAILDLETSQITKLRGHTDIVRDVAFAPDNSVLISCSRDKTLKIWNTTDYQTSSTIRQDSDSFTEIAISPDSRFVLTGSLEGHARVYEIATGHQVAMLSGHTDRVLSVAFLADNSGIVTACKDGNTNFYAWNPAQISPVLAPRATVETRGSYPAQVISSADGKSIYIGNDNGSVKKINVATALEEFSTQVDQPLWKLAISADGTRLLTNTRWSVRLLNLPRLEGRQELTDWTDATTTPQDALPLHLATMVKLRDQAWNADRTWITTTGLTLARVDQQRFFVDDSYHIYSPDRTLCVVVDPDTLEANIKVTSDNRTVFSMPANVLCSAFSPDGQTLLFGTQVGIVAYNTRTWEKLYTLPFDSTKPPTVILFMPDGTQFIAASLGGGINRYYTEDGREGKPFGYTGSASVLSMDISHNGKLLATGLDVDRAMVLDIETGDVVSTMSGHVRYVHAVKFAPSADRLVTLSRDGTAKMWDVASGRELVTVFNASGNVIPLGIVFSPTGRFIAAAMSDRRVVLTEVFPWGPEAYKGEGSLEDRIELWKRRTRLSPQATMEAITEAR